MYHLFPQLHRHVAYQKVDRRLYIHFTNNDYLVNQNWKKKIGDTHHNHVDVSFASLTIYDNYCVDRDVKNLFLKTVSELNGLIRTLLHKLLSHVRYKYLI